MRFFVAALCLALVATNDAFFTDTLTDIGNALKGVGEKLGENLLPTLINIGTTALIGAVGKRDVEDADLATLEDAIVDETYDLSERLQKYKDIFEKLKQARTDGNVKDVAKEIFNAHLTSLMARLPEKLRTHVQKTIDEMKARIAKKTEEAKTTQEDETDSRMDKLKAFIAKFKEAKEQGTVKELVQKHMEEQKKAFLARLSPEQKQKFQDRMDKIKKVQENLKACREEVMKTKKDGDNVRKMTMDCFKAKMAPEETKTQEDETMTRAERMQKAKEARAAFMKKLEEAKKAGTEKEFWAAHKAEMEKKREEAKQKWLATLTPEQKAKYEERMEKREKFEQAKKTCREEAAKAKTDDSTRREMEKMFRDCMKKNMAPEETKAETYEDKPQTWQNKVQKAVEEHKAFLAKLNEAKAAGKLQEFLKAHHEEQHKKMEEQKQKWIASLTPEQKAKYEAHQKRMEEMRQKIEEARTKMQAHMKKMQEAQAACKTEVQNTKKDGDNVHMMFHECMKKKMMPEEKKTQEDETTMTREEKMQKAKEARAEFMKKLEEAKKAGTEKEFLAAHKAEMEKKREEAKQKWLASLTPEQKAKYEARMEKKQKYMEAKKACKEEAEKAKTDTTTRMEMMKMVKECMKQKMAPEDKTTQEDETAEEKKLTWRERMQKAAEERKAKWLANLTPEEKAKYEERVKKMEEMKKKHEEARAKLAEQAKKWEEIQKACREEVMKTKKDGDNVRELFRTCYKGKLAEAKKAAETKTEA